MAQDTLWHKILCACAFDCPPRCVSVSSESLQNNMNQQTFVPKGDGTLVRQMGRRTIGLCWSLDGSEGDEPTVGLRRSTKAKAIGVCRSLNLGVVTEATVLV